MAVEVTTASGVKLDIIIQGKFQPTYFGNFDLDSSKEDAATGTSAGAVQVGDEHRLFGATGETSFGSYDVYWMPINDGLISNSTDPSRPTANVANGEPDRDVYASKFDTDLGNDSRVSPS